MLTKKIMVYLHQLLDQPSQWQTSQQAGPCSVPKFTNTSITVKHLLIKNKNINQSKSSLLIWHYVSYLFLFSFYLLICFTFCLFPWIFSHKTWYSIYKIRPCRIWMHVFICFSVVHFLTWTFSLSLRSLYSVILVHGYKLINHLKMSHVTRNPVFGVCDQVIHFS